MSEAPTTVSYTALKALRSKYEDRIAELEADNKRLREAVVTLADHIERKR